MINKKGISLIVLIITIIVVIILASAVILNLTETDIIGSAEEAVIRSNFGNLDTELEMYHADQYVSSAGGYNPNLLSADYDGVYYNGTLDSNYGDDIYDVLSSLEDLNNYDGSVEIVNGSILYTGEDSNLRQIASSMGLTVGAAFSSEGLVDSGISYVETTSTLLNPERGFYKYSRVDVSSSYLELEYTDEVGSALSVINDCQTENKTLTLFKISLEGCRNVAIPSEWLTGIDNIADLYRQAGIKLVVRVDYGNDNDTFAEPDNFSQIIAHMDQLESFFTTNEDIIHVVEAGFLGTWGEWYYTTYGDDTSRLAIINKLLEVVPSGIQINLRTPDFYRLRFGSSTFDENLGYTTAAAARVGIHNDAFLKDETDSGTYAEGQRATELAFLEPLTKYTLFGGECTMDGSSTYNDTANTISEMTTLHMNYLNGSYQPEVISKWQGLTDNTDSVYSGQTTYKLVADRLGYRFVLKDSKLPSSIASGENLNISVDIENTGFGNLVNGRDVYLLLEKDNSYYKAKIDTDVRRWFSGTTTDIDMVFQLPGNIEAGTWNAYIQLPDSNSSLTHENYFVKFANASIWDSSLKANYIGDFTVTSGTANNDNNIYQLNAENIDTTNYGVTTSYQPKVVDGNNTDGEWTASNIVYDQGGNTIYMDNDEEYLYLYVDNGGTPYAFLEFYFDNLAYTSGNRFDGAYKFLVQGNWGCYLYTGAGADDWNWNQELAGGQYDVVSSSGTEYRIPLSFLQVSTSGSVLQNIRFITEDGSGTEMLDMEDTTLATYTLK